MIAHMKYLKSPRLLTAVVFFFFFTVSFMFPYTGDDWAWGSSIGIQRLATWFENYNGRYSGNLLVLLLTRSRILRALFMTVSYTLICHMCYRYLEETNIVYYLFSVILFLCMPKEMLREAVVWTSGYANYVPSAMIALLLVMLGKRAMVGNEANDSRITVFSLGLLTYIGSMFMEHITLFLILASFSLTLYSFRKYSSLNRSYVSMLIGSVLGAVCMFSNSAYRSAINGSNDYQKVATDFGDFISSILFNMTACVKSLIYDNWIMCMILSVFLAVLCGCLVFHREQPRKKIAAVLFFILHVSCLVLNLYSDAESINSFFIALFSFGYLVTTIAILIVCINREYLCRILYPLFCGIAVSAPLLVVNPIGPRCCFVTYLFLMVFLEEILYYLLKNCATKPIFCKIAAPVLYLVVLSLMLSWGLIFSRIFLYDQKRNDFSKLQSNTSQQVVIVGNLPHLDYLHCSIPHNELWATRYKLFHGLREDVTLETVSLGEMLSAMESFDAGIVP